MGDDERFESRTGDGDKRGCNGYVWKTELRYDIFVCLDTFI